MRQFDVYRNPSPRSRTAIPYVVVLQSHYFEGTPTVIVAPLIPDDGRVAYKDASVRVEFGGTGYVASIPELVAVDRDVLRTLVGDVRFHQDEIRRALDRIFTGF